MGLLDTPDVRQRTEHTCGPCTFTILWRFHFPESKVPSYAHLADPVIGLSAEALEAMVWKAFGYVVKGHLDLDALGFLARRSPVLCVVTVAPGEDHWVAVRGVTRSRVHVQCPSEGRLNYTHADWLTRWVDSTAGGAYYSWGVTGWPRA